MEKRGWVVVGWRWRFGGQCWQRGSFRRGGGEVLSWDNQAQDGRSLGWPFSSVLQTLVQLQDRQNCKMFFFCQKTLRMQNECSSINMRFFKSSKLFFFYYYCRGYKTSTWCVRDTWSGGRARWGFVMKRRLHHLLNVCRDECVAWLP